MDDITDEEALAILALHALNELYQARECCPECCWPCDALKRLSDRPDGPGSLNAILTHAPLDSLPSGAQADSLGFRCPDGSINQEWLKGAWTRTSCHEDQQ